MRKNNLLIFLLSVVLMSIITFFMATLVSSIPSWKDNTYQTNKSLAEDSYYSYNFTSDLNNYENISFYEIRNVNLTNSSGFQIAYSNSNAAFPWIFWNDSTNNQSTSGILIINSTDDNQSGILRTLILAHDFSDNSETAVTYTFVINTTNDAPVFAGLQNESFNMSSLFERIINITDEENNIPFSLNITFLNCSTAQWSTRNNINCTLFNSSQYSFNQTAGILNISFTPSRNDVGDYIINFTASDSGNTSLPYNASTSMLVNFSVLVVNSIPYFTYLCDNERNATEDAEFTCRINVSDVDELNNLTISANYSWFLFNGSSNSMSQPVNITTGYNTSFIVNFTPRDLQVGNWSINISIKDTGSPQRINSSIFWFFINNTEDLPSLDFINNYTIYENKTIYVNATDDDLLVSDKRVKNESLSFASNNSAVNISFFSSSENKTIAKITINFNGLTADMNHTIKINLTDTAGNYAERNFTVEVLSNNAPAWNQTSYVSIYYEGNNTYLNLSKYVSDLDAGDSIIFSYTNDTSFPSFSLNSITGIINFNSVDEDVGQHILWINATDGKLNSLAKFNFTIYNVNDAPFIESITDQITSEDNATAIQLYIYDEDLKIPIQIYNESLFVNLTIYGVNASLFSFSLIDRTNDINKSYYLATFTPGKSDVGIYNITINVTDLSNASSFISFNLTVNAINHAPVLMNLTNQTSSINRTFYYRINASDVEDGNSADLGNNNFTFSYNFTSGSSFLNSTNFNSTTGIINITFNSSQEGRYRINITVRDLNYTNTSSDFWLFVYGIPNVTFPLLNYEFNLAENTQSNLTFRANHSVEDNLTFVFYVNNILRNNLNYYGNNTNLTWQFTPNYTDETFEKKNLTLVVINNLYPELNFSVDWNITINHTNYPINFSGHIDGSQANYDQQIVISLDNYFSDIDNADSAYNQTINFSIASNLTPSYITPSFNGFTLTLSSLIAISELLTITASDLNSSNYTLSNASSNVFQITFTTPSTTPTPTPSSGGGTTIKPILLKIILPEPVSAYKKERIVLPIALSNMGKVDLSGISLSGSVTKNNVLRDDFSLSFSKPNISSLAAGKSENVTLTINIGTEEPGLYEITVSVNVKSPSYSDWAKLYLTVKEGNATEILEKIVFTEELIAENPQCIEIKEIIEEARKYYSSGEYSLAVEKAKEAVEACKESIAQTGLAREKENAAGKNIFYYFVIFVFASIIIGLAYYYYKRIKFERTLARMNKKIDEEINEYKV